MVSVPTAPTVPSRPSASREAVRTAIGCVCLALSAACAGEGTGPEAVASLTVSPTTATIASRAPLPMTAAVRTAGGKSLTGRPVLWSSSDTSVARVTANGLVTAGVVVDGTTHAATITASSEGVSGSATIGVLPAPVASVATSATGSTIAVGASMQFSATLSDATALPLSGRVVTWGSSDSSIAFVDGTGLVTSLPYGGGETRTVTISATSEGRTGTSSVQVIPTPVASVTLANDSVAVGDTRLMIATPRDASGGALWGRPITWSTSDSTVATVTSAGLVVPAQRWDMVVRTATITASAGSVVGAAAITVLPAPVRSIAVTPSSGSLPSGGMDTLSAVPRSISGVALDGRPVTWSSSAPSILAVDAAGILTAGVVTGGSAMAVTITASSDGFSSAAVFSVLPSPVASLVISPDSLSLFPQQTSPLGVIVRDGSGTTLSGRTTLFATSDPSVVTVSAAGVLSTPNYDGQVTRTAFVTAVSEGHADTVRVVVEPHRVVTVTLSPNTAMLPSGAQQRVVPVLRNGIGGLLSDRSIQWSSADPSIATVSDSGVITLVGSGSTIISATAEGVNATVAISSMPSPIVPSTLVAGAYHHCGLSSTGQAYCWGWNGYGQLGDGTNTQRDHMVAVLGGLSFKMLSAGSMFTCGLTTADQAYCWGWNANGQLGDGTTDHRSVSVPQPVAGGHTFSTMATGWYHGCGIEISDGSTWCWGRNNLGQLGDGTGVDHSMPELIANGHRFVSVIAKYSHTCGLTAAGAAWCWGRNAYGASGDGTVNQANIPVEVLGGRVFTKLVVGWDHTCGITASGVTECVGRNQYGQLGDGVGTGGHLDLQPVTGGIQLRSLHSGFYSMCAVSTDNRAVCWGRNHQGELGDGTTTNAAGPIVIAPTEQFQSLAVGYGHTCAIVASGAIQCWGTLSGGALGDALPPASPIPFSPLRGGTGAFAFRGRRVSVALIPTTR
ncbi:MAG: Ig-like domain-containing protein [Gemmatimonadaceae bacterium]|nr:Ig-like domain-containing protein [Gemmatimonadaceae bacterium]